MSDTNQLPFLRCPPRKIKINNEQGLKVPGVLFCFNDILSIYPTSDDDDFEEDPDEYPNILIKKPDAIASIRNYRDGVEIFTTASHPNVYSYGIGIRYSNKKYYSACLGDYYISCQSFNNHNILAGLVYRYLSEYSSDGYSTPIESYIDNKFKCHFCKKNLRKPSYASNDIYRVSDIPGDFIVPCLTCCEKPVNITNSNTRATLRNKSYVSIFDLFELDVDCRRIKYSRKDKEYIYND